MPAPKIRRVEVFFERALLVLLAMGAASIVFCQHLYTDESWALFYARNFRATGTYSTYFFTNNIDWVFYKPVVWMTLVVSSLVGYDHFWAFRVSSLLAAAAAVGVLDRLWRGLRISSAVRIFLVAALVVWAQRTSAGLISARPEMWYFLSISWSVYSLTRVDETCTPWLVAVAIDLLAVTTHPNGILGFIPLVLALPAAWSTARSRLTLKSAIGFTALILVCGAFAFWTLVYNFPDFASLWSAFRTMAGDPGHRKTIFDELERYRMMHAESKIVLWMILGMISAAMAALFSASDRRIRLVAATALLTLIAMAVQGAKWTVYFAAAMPALSTSTAWLLERVRARIPNDLFRFALLGGALLLTVSVFSKNRRDLHSNTLAQWLMHDPNARRDREIVVGIVGKSTLHSLPDFFPFVPEATFVPYWDARRDLTPWRTIARFKIDRDTSSDFEVVRHRFIYDGLPYVLSENVSDQSTFPK